jgi:hypothetical protein
MLGIDLAPRMIEWAWKLARDRARGRSSAGRRVAGIVAFARPPCA